MKAFAVAHLFLAPFLLFTIGASLGQPLVSALAGLAIGVMFCVGRYGVRVPPAFMSAQLIGLAVVVPVALFDSDVSDATLLGVVFAFLAVGSLVSVGRGAPWTAELSAGDMGSFAQNPAFIGANNLFSLMWAGIYAWFSWASFAELAPAAKWIPMAVGGLLSVIGPRLLMKLGEARGLFDAGDLP